MRQTAYNVHSIPLLGKQSWALTLAGLKQARTENFRQKTGRARPKMQPAGPWYFRTIQGSSRFHVVCVHWQQSCIWDNITGPKHGTCNAEVVKHECTANSYSAPISKARLLLEHMNNSRQFAVPPMPHTWLSVGSDHDHSTESSLCWSPSHGSTLNSSTMTTREHWIQCITFVAETNAAYSRGSADRRRHRHIARQFDINRHNTLLCSLSGGKCNKSWGTLGSRLIYSLSHIIQLNFEYLLSCVVRCPCSDLMDMLRRLINCCVHIATAVVDCEVIKPTCELTTAFVFEDLATLAGFTASTSPAPFYQQKQTLVNITN